MFFINILNELFLYSDFILVFVFLAFLLVFLFLMPLFYTNFYFCFEFTFHIIIVYSSKYQNKKCCLGN